ncbi:MAG: hypothetical protein JXJ22_05280 [Bacteroidales bacterium]|nr:hypothetical protein [Bacteroidales bacterium]
MIKIQIDTVWNEKYPQVRLGIFDALVTTEKTSEGLWKFIENNISEIQHNLEIENISKIPAIKFSRQAYKAIGNDPSRYRLSAEALLRRIVQGKGLYRINNVIDVLNLISVKYGYSIGGYDYKKIIGNIRMGIGKKNEPYSGIGRGELNIENLPVLRDDTGAFGTPTSDSERTKVDMNTGHFLMVIFDFGLQYDMADVLDQTKNWYQTYANASEIYKEVIRLNHLESLL